jgi:hypothetical protein
MSKKVSKHKIIPGIFGKSIPYILKWRINRYYI